MKINAITTNTFNQNKKTNTPAFKAMVRVDRQMIDVISEKSIEFTPVMNNTLSYLLPKLNQLSSNLKILITGAGKPFSLTHLFSPAKSGLKFDISIIDPKRLKYEILSDRVKMSTLSAETIKDLKNNVDGMSECMTMPRKFGKLYNPWAQTEQEYKTDLYRTILDEIENIPKNNLESEYAHKVNSSGYGMSSDCFKPGRNKYDCYAGIEY